MKKTWGLTNEALAAYIKQIGLPFNYDGSMLKGVDDLIAKLKAALELIKQIQGGTKTAPVIPGAPAVIPKAGDPALGGSKTDSAARAASSAAAAAAYAAAKAAGDMDAAAKAAAGVNPSALASQESGAIGAASIAAQLKAAEAAQRAEDIAAAQATQLANFRAKEAADAAAAAQAAKTMDYDERFKFRAAQGGIPESNTSSTFDVGSFRMAENRGMTINLNVEGNLQTEKDIVEAIRQGLLAGQTNGNTLTLQAI
jgi:hypothetical protein